MRILVSNDDGVHAPGIKALAESLAPEHEVYVVAPDRERSAAGHGLTLHKPLRAEPVDHLAGVRGAWAINGLPTDCVKLAFGALLRQAQPEMVISGINRGPNLGSDVLYSGTVSAALEGSIQGVPAVAMSLAGFADVHYDVAAAFVLRLVKLLQADPLPPRVLLNVNVPAVSGDEVAGVRVARLGMRRYNDVFEPRVDMRGKTYYWLAGELVETDEAPDTDVIAIRDRYIAITPIHYDLTAFPLLDPLKRWERQAFPAGAT